MERNSPSAASYNRKSILWCAATWQVPQITMKNNKFTCVKSRFAVNNRLSHNPNSNPPVFYCETIVRQINDRARWSCVRDSIVFFAVEIFLALWDPAEKLWDSFRSLSPAHDNTFSWYQVGKMTMPEGLQGRKICHQDSAGNHDATHRQSVRC